MPLSEIQRQNLAKLDILGGTGIFTNNTKVDSIDQPTVIISLGGLGGKTLGKLKTQILHRVNKEDNSIRLLAIDSSDNALENLLRYNLTTDEVLSLYEPEINTIYKNEPMPSFVKNWIDDCFSPSLYLGARQNGRFLLSFPVVYNKVRKKIKEVITSAREAAPNGRTNIIFIAGISGGTGSGIFIDMAYIVQDILKNDIGMATRQSYNMSAYLYMPDVQIDNGAHPDALRRNGYAALKELDYFYNLDKVGGVYEWPFIEGPVKNSKDNIYDLCTIVSSYTSGDDIKKLSEEETINLTVESIMTVITNAELIDKNGQPWSIFSTLLDHYQSNIEVWMIFGNGMNYELFPRSANYKYNVIGYGSAQIPVDAIMSYIALKMYENLIDEYQNMNELTPEFVTRIMNSVGLGSIDSIIKDVKETAYCSYSPSETPKGSDVHGIKGSYCTWRDRAIEHYVTIKNTKQFTKAIDIVTNRILSCFDTRLNAVFGEKGPYFVVKSLTASLAADGVDGILRKIDALISTLSDEYDRRIERCNTADCLKAYLDENASKVPSFLGFVKQDDRDAYIKKAKSTIETFTIDMEIIARMQNKLIEVRNALVDSNNKVFDVYTEVLDYIKYILSKNCDTVLKREENENENDNPNIFNIVNLDTTQENGKRLKRCLDSFLTPELLAKFKDEFETILRAPKNRPAFTDKSDMFNAAKLVQKLFDELLGTFYQEAVERFLIAYYSDSADMDNIEKLDAVMANEAEKKEALLRAASAICRELQNKSKPLCRIIGGTLKQFDEPKKYICCPAVLYDAFTQVVPTYFPERIMIYQRENAFSIDVLTNHIGIPLTKIYGIDEADRAYDQAISSCCRGLHLNESKNSDFTMLPSPFVREAWGWVEDHSSAVENNNVMAVERLTSRLKELNLIEYDTDSVGITCNVRVKHYFEDEITDDILDILKNKVICDVNSDTVNIDYIISFLDSAGIKTTTKAISIFDRGLSSRLENINIIVRKNIVLYRELFSFLEKYEKINKIIEMQKMGGIAEFKFNINIAAFTNLIKTGIVSYNPDLRTWNYFDGQLEKPLYNFAMKSPFERAYNLYFAFVAYCDNIDDKLKEVLNALANEKLNNKQAVSDIPDEIKAYIDNLYSPGVADTAMFLLDRELNRATVNGTGASMHKEEFSIPLLFYNDVFEALIDFYNAVKAQFN